MRAAWSATSNEEESRAYLQSRLTVFSKVMFWAISGEQAIQSPESPADRALALARGGRTAREWVRQIRALSASQGAGYRSAGLSEEQLLQVVRDASASPSLRAGAAVALAQVEGDGWKSELRTVAEACANPHRWVSHQRDDGSYGLK
jgi:hypothetical protein